MNLKNVYTDVVHARLNATERAALCGRGRSLSPYNTDRPVTCKYCLAKLGK